MLSSSSSSAGGWVRRSTMSSSSSSAASSGSSATSSSSLIEGPAVFSLISPSASSPPSSVSVELLGGRALRQHRLEVEDLAQLHPALVERVRPVDDGVEGDRAFAQAPDHRVAAGLDALGDGDLALAGEQFHRAHLAQVHAHRIVGAVDGFLLGRRSGAGAAVVERIDLVLDRRLGVLVLFLVVLAALFILDDVDAHVVDRGHDVLDLLGDIWSCGSASLSSSIGDVAALLGAGDQLLDRCVVEVDQRGIAAVGRLDFRWFVFRHVVPPLNRVPARCASLCLNPCCASMSRCCSA